MNKVLLIGLLDESITGAKYVSAFTINEDGTELELLEAGVDEEIMDNEDIELYCKAFKKIASKKKWGFRVDEEIMIMFPSVLPTNEFPTMIL